jgi:hypothetical protein
VIFGKALGHGLLLVVIYTVALAMLGGLADYSEWLYLPLVMTGIYTGAQIKHSSDRDTAADRGAPLGLVDPPAGS